MRITTRSACALSGALVLWAASAAASAAVLVVAPTPGPGVSYTTPQAAIDAATPGDVVLVRTGAYPQVTIDGKGIELIADAGATVVIAAGFAFDTEMNDFSFHNVVKNVPNGQRVVLRGLSLRGLEIANCAGAIWIEDCIASGVAPALRATNAARVDFVRGEVHGLDGFVDTGIYVHTTPGDGFVAIQSTIAIVGATVDGGDGQDFTLTMVGPIAPNAARTALVLHCSAAAGCTFGAGSTLTILDQQF